MAKQAVEQADIELIEADWASAWLLYGKTAKGKAVAESTVGAAGPDGADRVVDPRVLVQLVTRLLGVARVSVALFPRGS